MHVLPSSSMTMPTVLNLLKDCGIELAADTDEHTLIDRLNSALRGIKSWRERNGDESRDPDPISDQLRKGPHGGRDHIGVPMSAEPLSLSLRLTEEDLQRLAQGIPQDKTVKQPGQTAYLDVTRDEANKMDPAVYTYSHDEQSLIAQWLLFDIGARSTAPSRPRPQSKPVLRIRPGAARRKISDAEAEANGEKLLTRMRKPRWEW